MGEIAESLDINGFIGRAAVAFELLTVPTNQKVGGSNPFGRAKKSESFDFRIFYLCRKVHFLFACGGVPFQADCAVEVEKREDL